MSAEPSIEALRSGNGAAWKSVFSEYGEPTPARSATRMLKNRSIAEDVVQDSLVSAYNSVAKLDGRSSLKTWLVRIGHYRTIDELRRGKRYVHLPDDDPEASYFNARGGWADGSASRSEDQLDAGRMAECVRARWASSPTPTARSCSSRKRAPGLHSGVTGFWFAWSVHHPGARVWNSGINNQGIVIDSTEGCAVPCDEIRGA